MNSRRIPVLTLCLFLAGTAATHAADVFDDITVSADPMDSGTAYHGYLEHRFHVGNRSATRPHQVTLQLPRSAGSYGNFLRRISRTVAVSPGSDCTVSLFQPSLRAAGDGKVAVLIDGGYAGEIDYRPSRDFEWYGSGHGKPQVLVSRSLNIVALEQNMENTLFPNVTNRTPAAAAPHSHYGSGSSSSRLHELFDLIRTELDAPAWKENWLAYSSFDGIFLSEADLKRMPPNAREAVLRYVECGGSLVVAGSMDIPHPWKNQPWHTPSGLKGYAYGFGQCILIPTLAPEQLNRDQIQCLQRTWGHSLQPWTAERSIQGANASFPVIDKITVPYRALFVIMIVFAVLIGPVNLFILHRMNRPIWALWTIPLVSAITAGIVIVYAFASEGITPTLRIESVTILDQSSHRAATLGMASYYCPLTPRAGLRFGYDTEVSRFVEENWRHRNASSGRTVDWTRDQHLASDWVSARVPAPFLLRKSERRRERVEITRTDGGLAVVNGLGADIRNLWVADGDGKVYAASGISMGKQITLSAAEKNLRAPSVANRLASFYAGANWQVSAVAPSNAPAQLLAPGTYVALLDSCPFMEKALSGKARENTRSVILGFWEQP